MSNALMTYINSHENWEAELAAAPYNLTVAADGEYRILKYSQIESDFSLEEVREARGIIVRREGSKWICVCAPFSKFFNSVEPYAATDKIDWSSAQVEEKIDGSLIKVWWDRDQWHVSTNGTIDAFKAKLQNDTKYESFGDIVVDVFETRPYIYTLMDKSITYMFELVSPYSRVVIPYDHTEMYLIGMKRTSTFVEEDPLEESISLGCPAPKRYKLGTYEDVVFAADKLEWDQEGFVVVDKNFNRIKVKSPAYLKAHYARTNKAITREYLVGLIVNEEVDDFLTVAADYQEAIDQLKAKIESLGTMAENARSIINQRTALMDRKGRAQCIQKYFKPSIHDFLYKNEEWNIYIKRLTPKKILEMIDFLSI